MFRLLFGLAAGLFLVAPSIGCSRSTAADEADVKRRTMSLLAALETGEGRSLDDYFTADCAPEGLAEAHAGPMTLTNAVIRFVEPPSNGNEAWRVHYSADVGDLTSTLFHFFVLPEHRTQRTGLDRRELSTQTGTLEWKQIDGAWKITAKPAAAEPLARACAASQAMTQWALALPDLRGTPLLATLPGVVETLRSDQRTGGIPRYRVLQQLANRLEEAEDRGATTVIDAKFLPSGRETLSSAVHALAAADEVLSSWWRGKPEFAVARLRHASAATSLSYDAPDVESLLIDSPVRLASFEFRKMTYDRAGNYHFVVQAKVSHPAAITALGDMGYFLSDPRRELSAIDRPVEVESNLVVSRAGREWLVEFRETEGMLGYLATGKRALNASDSMFSEAASRFFTDLDFPELKKVVDAPGFSDEVAKYREQFFEGITAGFPFLQQRDGRSVMFRKLCFHCGYDLARCRALGAAERKELKLSGSESQRAEEKADRTARVARIFQVIEPLRESDDVLDEMLRANGGESALPIEVELTLDELGEQYLPDPDEPIQQRIAMETGFLAGMLSASTDAFHQGEPGRNLVGPWFGESADKLGFIAELVALSGYTSEARDLCRRLEPMSSPPRPESLGRVGEFDFWFADENAPKAADTATTPGQTLPVPTPPRTTPSLPSPTSTYPLALPTATSPVPLTTIARTDAIRAFRLGQTLAQYRGAVLAAEGDFLAALGDDQDQAWDDLRLDFVGLELAGIARPSPISVYIDDDYELLETIQLSTQLASKQGLRGHAYFEVGYAVGMAQLACRLKTGSPLLRGDVADDWWNQAIGQLVEELNGLLYLNCRDDGLAKIEALDRNKPPAVGGIVVEMQRFDFLFY